MMWSPFDIEIMLHHYHSYDRCPRADAPIYPERLAALVGKGLLEYVDGIPHSTDLGAALVRMWCETPIPVAKYVDPRLEVSA